MSGGLADNIIGVATAATPIGNKLVGRDVLGDPLDLLGRRAEKERQAARKAEEKAYQLEQRREAIEAVRQAQLQRAEVAALGETVGIAGSSALTGALGSIQSQAGSNLLFQQQQNELRNLASARIQSAANKTIQARQIQMFGQIALQAYQAMNTQPLDTPDTGQLNMADQANMQAQYQEQFSRTV